MSDLIFIVIALITISSFCSGSEAAILSVNIGQVHSRKKKGDKRAIILNRIKKNPHDYISAIVILNNIANIVGSILAGALAAQLFSSAMVGVFSGLLTFLVIIFAEIIPKSIGERHANRLAFWIAPSISLLTKTLLPLIWITNKFATPFIKGDKAPVTSEEEIRSLAHMGEGEGVIEERERRMIEKVFKLNDVTAEKIMTPRTETIFIQVNDKLEEVKKVIEDSHYSRFPVYDENFDDIVGVIHSHKILSTFANQKKNMSVKRLLRPVFFVKDEFHGDQLLRKFQRTHEHIFVVQDDHGGTAGIVTLEDVLEELVGEIEDERDVEKD